MKLINLLFFMCSFLTTTSQQDQNEFSFELLFGSYMNNHDPNTFSEEERKWQLKNGNLIYFISTHETAYTDTLKLKANDIQELKNHFIKILEKHIQKDLSVDYLDKAEWKVTIKGQLTLNKAIYAYDLEANSSSVLYEDTDARHFESIEQLLYAMTEKYK